MARARSRRDFNVVGSGTEWEIVDERSESASG